MATYLKPAERKEQILAAAIKVAEREGYMQMMRREIAEEAGCANGSVSPYSPGLGSAPSGFQFESPHASQLVSAEPWC